MAGEARRFEKVEEALRKLTAILPTLDNPADARPEVDWLRLAVAEEVERARLSISASEIEKAARAEGVAQGRREMAQWLESRAGGDA